MRHSRKWWHCGQKQREVFAFELFVLPNRVAPPLLLGEKAEETL